MNIFAPERQHALVFVFVFITSLLSVLLALGLVGFEAYIRWAINKDFMSLGGSGLSTLVASASLLVLGTGYLYRSGK